MKQQRHTPLYVPANPMGQGACRAEELFYGLWRAVVCLSFLVVLLACAGLIYADGEVDPVEWIDIQDVLEAQSSDSDPDSGIDPGSEIDPDSGIDPVDPLNPDYGGTADQDPAVDPWVDPGYVSDADYGVQPYSSAAYYWTQSEITAVVNAANNLILYNGQASIQTANSHLFDIYSRLGNIYNLLNSTNAGSFNARLKSIDESLDVNGYIPQRLLDIYARQAVTNSKLDTVNTNLVSIAGKLDTVNTNLTSIVSKIDTTNSRLSTANSRLSSLIDLVTGTNSRLDTSNTIASNILRHLRGQYYHSVLDSSFSFLVPDYERIVLIQNSGAAISVLSNSGGLFNSVDYVFSQLRIDSAISSSVSSAAPVLVPGVPYYFTISFPGSIQVQPSGVEIVVNSIPASVVFFTSSSFASSVSYGVYFTVSEIVPLDYFSFGVVGGGLSSVSGGFYRLSIVQAPSDLVSKLAVNPGQSGATQELQQAVDQTEAFEQKMFQDVSTYTSQLNFGLGDWAEAAAGISYIGSVFMLIWDNSPVQPIILSLMLGLCMLLLGRGAKVADAMPRSEGVERVASFKSGKGK